MNCLVYSRLTRFWVLILNPVLSSHSLHLSFFQSSLLQTSVRAVARRSFGTLLSQSTVYHGLVFLLKSSNHEEGFWFFLWVDWVQMFCSYFQGNLTTSELFSTLLRKRLLLLSKQHRLQLIMNYVTEFVICCTQRCSWWSFLTAAVAVGSSLLSSTRSSDLILFRSPRFLWFFWCCSLYLCLILHKTLCLFSHFVLL